MTFASTSAQMPPAWLHLYCSGIVDAKPENIYMLIVLYALPVIIIGWLIGMGILPIWGG